MLSLRILQTIQGNLKYQAGLGETHKKFSDFSFVAGQFLILIQVQFLLLIKLIFPYLLDSVGNRLADRKGMLQNSKLIQFLFAQMGIHISMLKKNLACRACLW